MVNGNKDLDLMFGSQRPYFDKTRLWYEKEEDEKLSKSSQSKVPTCIYVLRTNTLLKNAFKKKRKETEGEKAQKSY